MSKRKKGTTSSSIASLDRLKQSYELVFHILPKKGMHQAQTPSVQPHQIWHNQMVRFKTTKTNNSLNKKNKKQKEKKTFKVQNNLCTGAQKIKQIKKQNK